MSKQYKTLELCYSILSVGLFCAGFAAYGCHGVFFNTMKAGKQANTPPCLVLYALPNTDVPDKGPYQPITLTNIEYASTASMATLSTTSLGTAIKQV